MIAREEQGLASNVEQLSMDIDEAKVGHLHPSLPPSASLCPPLQPH